MSLFRAAAVALALAATAHGQQARDLAAPWQESTPDQVLLDASRLDTIVLGVLPAAVAQQPNLVGFFVHER